MKLAVEAARLKQQVSDLNMYSVRVGVVLSLLSSLAAIAILSKHVVNRWLFLPALTIPICLAVSFRSRMVLLGPLVYAAALLGILGMAIFFGM